MPEDTQTTDKPAKDADVPESAVGQDNPALQPQDAYVQSDVFAWANNLFEYKEDLKLELFWINKNNVLYRTKLDPQLAKQMQPLFLDNTLEQVLDNAEQGGLVRSIEDGEAEKGVLQRVQWKKIDKLREVMHWIRTQEHEIELFNEQEHDLKRIKGALVRATHPKMPQPFYLMKALSGGQMLKGEGTWVLDGNTFKPFQTAALKIPIEAHMLVIDQDLYVFNQPKLERLFGYDAKKNSIAEKKARDIEAEYSLSFAEGLDIQKAVQGSKAIINKLQNIEPGVLKQEQLLDHAEELGVDLMTDDNGAIIIMNQRDFGKFVNLLNDDYMESNLTGERYEIIKKRPLRASENDEGAMLTAGV